MPKASEMLLALQGSLTGFASGWTVLAAPNETYGDKVLDMAIVAPSRYGGFSFGGCNEAQNTVSVRLTLAAEPDKQASYLALCDALDSLMTRVFEQVSTLSDAGFQFMPEGMGVGSEPVTPVAERTGGKLFWSIEVFLPFRRQF